MFGTFELRRGDVPQRRVSTDSVVEHFDVLEQARLRRFAGRVVFVVDEFLLERGIIDLQSTNALSD